MRLFTRPRKSGCCGSHHNATDDHRISPHHSHGHGHGHAHNHIAARPDGPCLTDLSPGDTAQILSLHGGETFRRRLLALGLIPGSLITLQRKGPKGGGILITLGTSTLMVNAGLAERISIAPLPSPTL